MGDPRNKRNQFVP